MHALSNADFLSLWERGRDLHPLDQGLLAIHAAFPETREESVADWPLGRRNRALVELRSFYFGSVLKGWTSCGQCGDKLEFEMDGRTLAQRHQPDPGGPIVVNGHAFRLPTSRDLARIAGERDTSAAAIHFLEQCQIEAPLGGGQQSEGAAQIWSKEEVEAVGEKMAHADPLAEIVLTFQCPACGETCNETLDLPCFLWTEIDARARRLFLEIHALAASYGWTEAEILSLSDARRQLYLEMVHA